MSCSQVLARYPALDAGLRATETLRAEFGSLLLLLCRSEKINPDTGTLATFQRKTYVSVKTIKALAKMINFNITGWVAGVVADLHTRSGARQPADRSVPQNFSCSNG